jgi:hypothetical protein
MLSLIRGKYNCEKFQGHDIVLCHNRKSVNRAVFRTTIFSPHWMETGTLGIEKIRTFSEPLLTKSSRVPV